MAIKKTRFRPKGKDNYETIIHFETSADIVKTTDGSNVQSKLDELKNNYNNILNDIEDIQSDLDSKETPSGAQAKANQALKDAKSYTDNKVAELVASAPETLDTLNELAEALGKDPNFATTVANQIGTKADKTTVDNHINDKSNPHNVTVSQIGAETPAGAQAKADTAEANAKNYADTIVGIVDRNLEAHKNDNVTVHGVARGISNFAGNGNEVTIPHGLGVTPTSAYAFPTSNPEGYLGEVWIRMDDTNLYIGNSGSFTGEMCWVAIK